MPITFNGLGTGQAAFVWFFGRVGMFAWKADKTTTSGFYDDPTSKEALDNLSSPWRLLVIAILTFSVPMNMIGLASSHALDGLNPLRVFKSIGRVIGHYTFLFLIVLLYLCIYVALMYGIMSWAVPYILDAMQKGLSGGLLRMLLGIAAWSLLIGLAFYFAYSIGRVLGLFTRKYSAGRAKPSPPSNVTVSVRRSLARRSSVGQLTT